MRRQTELLLASNVNVLESKHGYIHINDNENEGLYYAFYPAKSSTAENIIQTPIILWLGGGPGQSSLLALFQGIGKYQLDSKGTLKEREVSWNDEYSILFVDSPVGVGFSYEASLEKIPTNSKEVAKQLIAFLDKFFKKDFKQYEKTPFFIFGEGFAAHYIIPLAQTIIDEKEKEQSKRTFVDINLKGIGFGNGWVDPPNQLKDIGLIAYTLGFVDEKGRQAIEKYQLQAVLRLQNNELLLALFSRDKILETLMKESGIKDLGNYNQAERNTDQYKIENYLNQEQVKNQFKVKTDKVQKFSAHRKEIYTALSSDTMKSVADKFGQIVNHLPVLIWSGQYDLITPTATTINWLNQLQWTHANQWKNQLREEFKDDHHIIGMKKCTHNLCLIMIDHCGHYCAEERPKATKYMIKDFVKRHK